MELTPIENLVFQGQNLVHRVIMLIVEQGTLTLTVSPQLPLHPLFTVRFHRVEHLHEEVLAEDTALPWDIIGFDSYALSPGQWEFILHCLEKEVVWNSSWPTIVSEMM